MLAPSVTAHHTVEKPTDLAHRARSSAGATTSKSAPTDASTAAGQSSRCSPPSGTSASPSASTARPSARPRAGPPRPRRRCAPPPGSGVGTWAICRRTNAAASPPGSSRCRNRAPVAAGSVSRSTRKVRQSAAVDVPGHEVPAAAERHQPVRLDQPPRRLAARGRCSRTAAARRPGRPARSRSGPSASTVGPPPPTHAGHGVRPQRVDPAAQPRRHHLHHLGQRPHRRLLDAGHRAGRRRAQADRDGDRLLVVEQQRRQRGAGLQLVAAGDARGWRRPGSRARAAGRRRGAACARSPRAGRPARCPASSGGSAAATAAAASGRSVFDMSSTILTRNCGQNLTAIDSSVVRMTSDDDPHART